MLDVCSTVSLLIVPGCRSLHRENVQMWPVDGTNGGQQRREQNSRNTRSGKERNSKAAHLSESSQGMSSWKSDVMGSNAAEIILPINRFEAKLETGIPNYSKQLLQYGAKLKTKCHQLKIPQTTFVDVIELSRKFSNREKQPLLDKITLCKGQWRKLDLLEILQSTNPRPIMKFGREKLFRNEFTIPDNKDDMILGRSTVLCCIFDDLMRSFGWKVGDTFDIEDEIQLCSERKLTPPDITGPLSLKSCDVIATILSFIGRGSRLC